MSTPVSLPAIVPLASGGLPAALGVDELGSTLTASPIFSGLMVGSLGLVLFGALIWHVLTAGAPSKEVASSLFARTSFAIVRFCVN